MPAAAPWPRSIKPCRRRADTPHAGLKAGDTDEAAWDADARTKLSLRACSDRDSARSCDGHQRTRGGPSEEARHGVIRLELSDQLLGVLTAFGDRRATRRCAGAAIGETLLGRVQRRCWRSAAESIVTVGTEFNQRSNSRSGDGDLPAPLPEPDAVRAKAQKIVEHLRIAETTSVPANFLPGPGRRNSTEACASDWETIAGKSIGSPGVASRTAVDVGRETCPCLHHAAGSRRMTMADDNDRHDDEPYFGRIYSRSFSALPEPSRRTLRRHSSGGLDHTIRAGCDNFPARDGDAGGRELSHASSSPG